MEFSSLEDHLIKLDSIEFSFVIILADQLFILHIRSIEMTVRPRDDDVELEVVLHQQLIVAHSKDVLIILGHLSFVPSLQVVQLQVGHWHNESSASVGRLLAERVLAEASNFESVLESQKHEDVRFVSHFEQPVVPSCARIAFEESFRVSNLFGDQRLDGIINEFLALFIHSSVDLGLN